MLEKEDTIEKKKLSIGGLTILTLIVIILVAVGIFYIVRMEGKEELDTVVAKTGSIAEENETIEYNGQTYALNEDIKTILVMGIDAETVKEVGGQSWSVDEDSQWGGGQADMLFLMVINPHTENINVIAINRNSMVDLDVFDEQGNYMGQFKGQICTQHGYGDGKEQSCERQVRTVSRMFDGIAINSYASIEMDSVPELTDAIGGVDVTVLDDIVYPEYDMDLHQGDQVNLKGKQAYWYVRLRDENAFNSNEVRLQRQKQFFTTFMTKAKEEAVSDIRVAMDLYNIASKYMVTDVDLQTFTYMASEYAGYNFSTDNIISLTGETVMGTEYEEFYPDEDALKQLIVDTFYEPVTD